MPEREREREATDGRTERCIALGIRRLSLSHMCPLAYTPEENRESVRRNMLHHFPVLLLPLWKTTQIRALPTSLPQTVPSCRRECSNGTFSPNKRTILFSPVPFHFVQFFSRWIILRILLWDDLYLLVRIVYVYMVKNIWRSPVRVQVQDHGHMVMIWLFLGIGAQLSLISHTHTHFHFREPASRKGM